MARVVTTTIGDVLRSKGEARFTHVAMDSRRRRLSAIVKAHADPRRTHIVAVTRASKPLTTFRESLKLRPEWKDCRIGKGDVVTIVYVPAGGPQGGASTGKQIGLAVATIALVVVASLVAGPIGGQLATATGVTWFTTAAATSLIQAGIVLGGTALLAVAMRAKANKEVTGDTRPLFGTAVGGNVPRAGDRRPVLYGRKWVKPDLCQPSASIYDGDDVVSLARMAVTEGECIIHAIRVGRQIAWTEGDGFIPPFDAGAIEWEEIFGTTSILVPNDIITAPAVIGAELPRPGDNPSDWAGPFPVNQVGALVNRLQFDLTFTGGISASFTTPGGKQIQGSPGQWGWEFQYAPIDASGAIVGAWVMASAENHTTHGFKLSTRPLRYTRFAEVPLGRYAVRGRNILLLTQGNPSFSNVDTITWDAARGWARDERVRPERTEIALRIRSSERLQGAAFGEIELDATRMLPQWTGTDWSLPGPTSKAVWAFADMRRNPIYGAGQPDNKLDHAALLHYASVAAPFDTFDEVVRGPVSNWEAMAQALLPMRAEPVNLGSVWTILRDEPRTLDRAHVLSRRQIVRGSTAINFDLDAADGSGHHIVEFDRDGDYRTKDQTPDIIIGLPSITPTRRHIPGIKTYDHAMHLGRWFAAVGAYRRETGKCDTEHDARIFKRGDPVALDVWFMDGAAAAGVVSRAGDSLEFDVDTPYIAGHEIVLRDRTGREWGPVALQSQGSSVRHLVLNAADRAAVEVATGKTLANVLARDDEPPTSARIGEVSFITERYLLRQISSSSANRFKIEAVNDDPRVWDVIGGAVTPRPPVGVGLADPVLPVVPRVDAHTVAGAASNLVQWNVVRARGAVAYQVEISYDGGTTYVFLSNDPAGQAELPPMEGAVTVNVRARAQGSTGLWGPWTYTSFIVNEAQLNIGLSLEVSEGDFTEQFRHEIDLITDPFLQGSLPRFIKHVDDLIARLGAANAEDALVAWEHKEGQRIENGKFSARFSQEARLRIDGDSASARLVTDLGVEIAGEFGAASVAGIHTEMLVYVDEEEALSVVRDELTAQKNTGAVLSSANVLSYTAAYTTEEEALSVVQIELNAQRVTGSVLSDANVMQYTAAYTTESEALTVVQTELDAQRVTGDVVAQGSIDTTLLTYATDEEAVSAADTASLAQFGKITAGGLFGMFQEAGPYAGSSAGYFHVFTAGGEVGAKSGLRMIARTDGTSEVALSASKVFFEDPNVDGGVPKQLLSVSAGLFHASNTFFKVDGQLITGIQRSAALSSDGVNPVMRADWDGGRLEVYD